MRKEILKAGDTSKTAEFFIVGPFVLIKSSFPRSSPFHTQILMVFTKPLSFVIGEALTEPVENTTAYGASIASMRQYLVGRYPFCKEKDAPVKTRARNCDTEV